MEINGSQSIGAPRQKVWDALNDPAVLRQCLPGCESVERVSPDEFSVVMAAAIGPLRARFNGKLRMTQAEPPKSCVMVFEGQGGAVGFGKGTSSVALTETADGTTLAYTANAQVGGKLAQVGSRLIDSVARKMADDFFNALRRQLVPTAEAVPASKPSAATSRSQADPAIASIEPPALPTTPQPAAASPSGPAMVPGWWLAVAMALGAAASLAGVVLAR